MARVQKVFISYRREDAADVAGRIRDWLVQSWHVPPDNVFMDVTAILPGADFAQVIEQSIAQCDAMIVVISPSWLNHVSTADISFPRFEAETALRRNLLVIPVLTSTMPTPTQTEMPESLWPLLRLNIRPVRADSFDYDMEWVRKAIGVRKLARPSLVMAMSAMLLVLLLLGVILSQVPVGNPVWTVFHPPAGGPTASTGSGTTTGDSGRPTATTVTASVSAVNGTYTGTCPPQPDATTYEAVISVSSGPITVHFRWTTSNGGDSDPSEQTVTFAGTGPQQQTVTHHESSYLPGQTVTDWVAVDLISPVNAQSNHADYTLTCQ